MPLPSSTPAPAATTTQASTTSSLGQRLVRVVSCDDWRSFIAWTGGSGNREAVFDAQIHDRPDSEDRTICVKLYPAEDGANRGLVNEITGWLIAHALKLPQPPRAYVMKVPLAELGGPLPAWVRQIKRTTDHYWAFATEKLPAESAAIQFNLTDQPLLIEDLKRWDNLPGAVALDEHIANTDRHLNNLLRLGKGSYALIDNGRIAVEDGERNWQTDDLEPGRLYPNLLSAKCWRDAPMKDIAAITLKAGHQHADALARVRDELEDWWRRLIDDDDDREAFRRFITERADSVARLLAQRYRLMPF